MCPLQKLVPVDMVFDHDDHASFRNIPFEDPELLWWAGSTDLRLRPAPKWINRTAVEAEGLVMYWVSCCLHLPKIATVVEVLA